MKKRGSRLTVTLGKQHTKFLQDRAGWQTAHTGQLVTPKELVTLALEFYQTFPLVPEKVLGWKGAKDGLLWPEHPWKGPLHEALDSQPTN